MSICLRRRKQNKCLLENPWHFSQPVLAHFSYKRIGCAYTVTAILEKTVFSRMKAPVNLQIRFLLTLAIKPF